MMEDMGVSPDAFEAMGDMVGAGIGAAMHMAPGDASPADMGAIMQDGLEMMMPEGTDVPPAITEAMGDLGETMGESGMSSHDVGAVMMGDPGGDTYLLPLDGDGNAVVEAGQPETCPAEAVQPPPADGACASTDMMPPEGGYDHAPMTDEFVMPAPFTTIDQMGAGGTGGGAGGSGGLSALSGAMAGGTGGGAGGTGTQANDDAISNAMDAAQEQGGGNEAGGTGTQAHDDAGGGMADADGAGGSGDVDPSAGMG
jgi:hypothetical protein